MRLNTLLHIRCDLSLCGRGVRWSVIRYELAIGIWLYLPEPRNHIALHYTFFRHTICSLIIPDIISSNFHLPRTKHEATHKVKESMGSLCFRTWRPPSRKMGSLEPSLQKDRCMTQTSLSNLVYVSFHLQLKRRFSSCSLPLEPLLFLTERTL